MWTCWYVVISQSDKYIWNWWKLYFRISTNTSDQKKCDLWVLFSLSVTRAKLNFHLNKDIMMKLGQIHVIRRNIPRVTSVHLCSLGWPWCQSSQPSAAVAGGYASVCFLDLFQVVWKIRSPAVYVKAWFSIWSFVFHLSCKMVKMS